MVRAWRAANPEKSLASSQNWRKANPAKKRAADRKRYADDPEKQREYERRWTDRQPERVRAVKKQASKKYSSGNKGKRAALCAARKAAKLQRTPAWADHEWIQHAYETAADMTAKMGESFHVDHVIPLRGKTVSGLHVYANLQILSARDNCRKSNRLLEAA